jgi:hypothetical protein
MVLMRPSVELMEVVVAMLMMVNGLCNAGRCKKEKQELK